MATFIKIASVTVGAGGASSIDFTSIPSTYTDLVIKICPRSADSGGSDSVTAVFNSSTSGYTNRFLYGSGSAVGSANAYTTKVLAGEAPANSSTSNTFGNSEVYIPNYAGSANKSYSVDSVQENNATTAQAYLVAGLWSNSATITSITLNLASAANFTQHSTATLYGIKNS